MTENTSPPPKGRIFISYRRADSAGYAGRIYDRLAANFGEEAIFMDVDTIEGGTDFVKVLEDAVQSCDVLIALIGIQWLAITDKDGKRRLDNSEDFVRIEIATALKRNIRVIPVLVDGVDMPQPAELPENLKTLVRRNALQVNHHSFNPDVYRLIEHTKSALDEAEELRVKKAQALQAAREKEERETAQKRAQEKVAHEKAEKDDKEKAEREAAEKAARERADGEESERIAKEKAEREVAEKAAREKVENDARLEAEERANATGVVKKSIPLKKQPAQPITNPGNTIPPWELNGKRRDIYNRTYLRYDEEAQSHGKPGKKIKTEYIVAIISAVVIIIVGVMSSPLIEKWFIPAPVATEVPSATFTLTSQSITPSYTFEAIQPSKTPTMSVIATKNFAPTVTPLPSEITDAQGVSMVLVPSSEFTMGLDNGGADNEMPAHLVYLNSYYIDKFEVTNSSYELCVNDGVCSPPKKRISNTRFGDTYYYGNPDFNNYPVIYVDWYMAETYCKWRKSRLPTEAEWEKAARGTDGRVSPWSENVVNCGLANYLHCVGDTREVGSYADGVSPYGVYDMAGNVSEWVADYYDSNYYSISPSINPLGPQNGYYRIFRGGAWDSVTLGLRSSGRYWIDPSKADYNIGFRCTKDAQP